MCCEAIVVRLPEKEHYVELNFEQKHNLKVINTCVAKSSETRPVVDTSYFSKLKFQVLLKKSLKENI